MPCHAAIAEKSLIILPSMAVETALEEMIKHQTVHAAVVSSSGIFEGLFSLRELMKNLLPVSLAMADGIQLDITVRAAPGVAKRLRNVMTRPVSEFMNRKPFFVYPQTPIWEGINAVLAQDSPLVVIDGDGDRKKFLGLITEHSMFHELIRMQQ